MRVLPRCPGCEQRISLSWYLNALPRTRWCCPNCSTVLAWRRRRLWLGVAVFVGSVLIMLADEIMPILLIRILLVFGYTVLLTLLLPGQHKTL